MPVEEKDRIKAGAWSETTAPSSLKRRCALNRWVRKPTPDLSKPFGSLYWPLAIPALLCALAAALLFARIIDLGAISVNWTLRFNVNIAVALIVLVAGALAIVPKAVKNPQKWHDWNTIISIVVLVLVAFYFLSGSGNMGPVKGLDLGTFAY